MNEPIISPETIYWINAIGQLNFAVRILFCIIAVPGFLAVAVAVVNGDFFKYIKYVIIWTIAVIILTGLYVTVPTRDAMYDIVTAKYTTPANLVKMKELGKDFKDIIDVLKQVNNGKNKD